MKKLHSLSFHLHWITLCCFLLPFFYNSCAEKKAEESVVDTTLVVRPVNAPLYVEDSILNQHPKIDTAHAVITDTTAEMPTSDKDELLSETIIKDYPIFEPILIPITGTHTGLGTIVNSLPFIPLFAATIAFLLLLISLLAKLIDKAATKIFLMIEVCAFIFLAVANPPFLFGHETLWGYWLCMLSLSTLLLIDGMVIYQKKRKAI